MRLMRVSNGQTHTNSMETCGKFFIYFMGGGGGGEGEGEKGML